MKISNVSHQIYDIAIQNTLTWHLKLDQPHLQARYKIQIQEFADGKPSLFILKPFDTFVKGEGWLFGKMISNPYPHSTQHIINPLQFIQTDQCGPIPLLPSQKLLLSDIY